MEYFYSNNENKGSFLATSACVHMQKLTVFIIYILTAYTNFFVMDFILTTFFFVGSRQDRQKYFSVVFHNNTVYGC